MQHHRMMLHTKKELKTFLNNNLNSIKWIINNY